MRGKSPGPSGALTRREFVGAAGALATASLVPAAAVAAHGAGTKSSCAVPLVAPEITVGLVQASLWPVSPASAGRDRLRNLERMVAQIEAAQRVAHHHWLAFGDAPLTGWMPWSQADIARVAVDIDGPEVRALMAVARERACHLSFGALLRDSRIADEASPAFVIVDASGRVAAMEHGRAGQGAVHRSAVGNLAVALDERPERIRQLADGGAEIIVRPTTAWLRHGQPGAPVLGMYAMAIGSASLHLGPPELCASAGPGASVIRAPGGEILAAAADCGEQVVSATLPLAAWRAARGTGTS